MSDLILPPGITLPPQIQPQEAPEEGATDEQKATMLPAPTGFRILCAVPDVAKTFDNTNILRADSYAEREAHATTVLFVLRMGPEAYKDTEKFPSGPWCKEGDFVLVRTYSGTRFKIYGKEFRILNDDQIDAVVDDPRGLTRA